ncbi:AraC family transcriptional regulator [Kitasatospora sp. GP82]|uniref:AraC family transcriptional regulator n=1 Tax=Kitasatospora sp. GP82 TaxID=3035089 RepID=UPI0024768C22|nr:AraC family transcriptional regulator [Kitasatospora sp. GP82]MDH6124145.1 AraC-like DNA-binding protein [Kitasatospora sp. GP82]
MDVLSDAITAMRTGQPHAGRSRRFSPWGIRFPASEGTGVHVVLQGSCWLLPADDSEPVQLGTGDVVLLPRGGRYGLADRPDTPLEEVELQPDGSLPIQPDRPEGSGVSTQLLCGAYQLNQVRAHPLLAGLPSTLHLPARVGHHPGLRAVVDLLGSEATDRRPGSDAAVPALLDTLLLLVLRAWFEEESNRCAAGWAAALGDPAVASALRDIHGDPARLWTVEELAARAGLSRAAFARRFAALVGQPPLGYLTWWRMTTAGRLLRADDAPLRVVSRQTGYTSEFAFAKAFKREYGLSPGQYRERHRPGRAG